MIHYLRQLATLVNIIFLSTSYAAYGNCDAKTEPLTSNNSVSLLSIQCKLYGSVKIIHVIDIDLNDKTLRLVPIKADNEKLATVPNLAKQRQGHVIAGINGGFFYFNPLNNPQYLDEICPARVSPPQGKLGDTLLQINGKLITTNCHNNFNGHSNFARAVIALPRDAAPTISRVKPGQPLKLNGKLVDALGAGPLLVSTGATGKAKVDIQDEGFGQWMRLTNVTTNAHEFYAVPGTIELSKKMRWSFDVVTPEHEQLNLKYHKAAALYSPSARTAVGIRNDHHLFLVTVRGTEDKSGMSIAQLAEFMMRYLHVNSALNLDGGGSTTMYIPNHTPEVVEPLNVPLRKIYNGLFLIKS
jgi:hypothetical protein